MISQRTLIMVASIIGLAGSVFTAGINYSFIQSRIDNKLDRMTYVEENNRNSLRITRDSVAISGNSAAIQALRGDVIDIKQRLTDVSCELVRPRRSYCR